MIHSVCAKHDNGVCVDCYDCEIQTHVNVLWSIFMHSLLPCNNSKSTRTFLEYKGIPVLEWPGYSPDMNPIEDVWNIMKRFVTKSRVKRIYIWKRVCEVWYSVAPIVREELLQPNAKENCRSY